MSNRLVIQIVFLLAPLVAVAQQDAGPPNSSDSESKPIPVVSGYAAFVPTWDAGDPSLVSIVSPVLLVPIRSNVVFESRGQFEGDFHRRNGNTGDFTGAIEKSLDYMQVDFVANPYLTITVGRFLTPFNIFNERLYPNWIRNTQTDPLIFPIGTGSDNGFMVRGAASAGRNLAVNYSAYFSTLSTTDHLQSERHAGMRVGMFLPRHRLEVGVSLQHQLQAPRTNRYGWYLEWQPLLIPFELRSEGAYSREEGNGLWVEGAYRLSKARFATLRRTQLVARTQLFNSGSSSNLNPDLPDVGTKRTEAGINYYLNDGWKALASYGKTFTAAGNSSIWTVGMTYRFIFPLGRSE